jgi:hypothetical protein
MEATKPTESATPEQLLKLLDLEFDQERRKRTARTPRNRASFLAAGIVFVIVGAVIALLLAEHLLVEMKRDAQTPITAAELE